MRRTEAATTAKKTKWPGGFCVFCFLSVFFPANPLHGKTAFSNVLNSSQQQDQSQTQNDDIQNKGTDKKKKNGNSSDVTFSDDVAKDLLEQLARGIEGHDQSQMLAAFDRDAMDGYLNFADQIGTLFDNYDSFRLHYTIDQATPAGAKGIVLVDVELEEIPASQSLQPIHKHDQLRFEMSRGKRGWKIVNVNPRNFFS